MTIDITEASKSLFIAYVNDAGNWSGTPMIGGNVQSTWETNGHLTQLKKAGLITTFESDGFQFVQFTDKGLAYAAELGLV